MSDNTTSPITEEQLAELERLEREATPGPWELKDGMLTFPPATDQDVARMSGASCCEWIGAMMPTLVAARNALPQLIAEVRRLRALVDAPRESTYATYARIVELDEVDVDGTVLEDGTVLIGKATRQVNGTWIAFARHPGCRTRIIVELGKLTLSKT